MLIHMTLSEAVAQFHDGCQTHRSHWISSGVIKTIKLQQVELVSGLKLPVSRHRRKDFDL